MFLCIFRCDLSMSEKEVTYSLSLQVFFQDQWLIAPIRRFYKATLSRTSGSYLCWSEEKLNHVLKTDHVKLFTRLLTNKILSKHILTWNFKMELDLRGRVWKFLGWKFLIVTAFFCKITIRWIVLKFWAQTREQWGKSDSKIAK